MKREIIIDDAPPPGEPLREKIAPENLEILDEEIRERAARVQSKLPRRELRRLIRRRDVLAGKLNRGKYNPLIQQRWELWQTCERIKHAMKSARGKKCERLRAELKATVMQGVAVDAQLAPLKPLAEEFAMIIDRLKAHHDVIEWEQKEKEDFDNFAKEAKVWLEQIKSVCRQNGTLNHTWKDEKGNSHTDIPIIERIIVKDDRVLYQIKTSGQGLIERFFGRWHSTLPYDVDITDLTCDETMLNLSAGCKRTVTVERSQNGVNLFWCISRMDSPDGIPAKFLYSKTLNWYPLDIHLKTPWAAGVSRDRKIEWFNFEDYPNVLIAGSPGGGKSNHLNAMIALIATVNTPDQVRMVMVDLKGGVEFVHWSELKHLLGPIVTSDTGVLEALITVREIMENRLQIFKAARAKKLSAYNARAAEPMPRLLIFVDEMSTLVGLGKLTEDIHRELRVISSQGRAAGVHLILATQHPSVAVLPGWVKTNMNMRIASKMPSHTASEIILDTVSAALLPVISGRMVFSVGREEIIAQSPYISDEEVAGVVRASHLYPDPVEEITDEQPVELKPEFSASDAVEIAITRLDGHLSSKRIHEIVGNEIITRNKLDRMVQEITQQKELAHDGNRYRILKRGKGYYLELLPGYRDEHVPGDTRNLPDIGDGIEILNDELEAMSA